MHRFRNIVHSVVSLRIFLDSTGKNVRLNRELAHYVKTTEGGLPVPECNGLTPPAIAYPISLKSICTYSKLPTPTYKVLECTI